MKSHNHSFIGPLIFFSKCCGILVLTQIIFSTHAMISKEKMMASWVSINRYNREVAQGIQGDKEISFLALGTSQLLNAFNTEDIPSSQVLAVSLSSSVELYYYLKDFLLHHKAPKVVFLGLPSHIEVWRKLFLKHNIKERTLNLNEIIDLGGNANQIADFRSLSSYDRRDPQINGIFSFYFHFLKSYFYSIDLYVNDVQRSLYIGDRILKKNALIYSLLFNNSGQYHRSDYNRFDHLVIDSISYYKEEFGTHFHMGPLFDLYLKKIIEITRESGIQLILAPMPHDQRPFLSLGNSYFERLQEYYTNLENQNEHVRYYHDRNFYPDDVFYDGLHFKREGQQLFMSKLSAFLKKLEFLQ